MPVSSAFFRCSAHPQGIGTNRFITILQQSRNWCGERNGTIPRGSRLPWRGRRISELISRPLLASAFEQGMVDRKSSCADGGKGEAPDQHGEREFVIVHGQIAARAVDLPDGYAHFDGQKKRRPPRKQSQDQEQAAEDFQYTGNVNEVARQAVVHEEALHPGAGVRQLRITVRKENQPERQAEDQQTHRLKGIERLHEKSSATRGKSLIRTHVDFSRKAKLAPGPAALGASV